MKAKPLQSGLFTNATVVTLAVAAVLAGDPALAAPARSTGDLSPAIARATTLRAGDLAIGPLRMDTPVHVVVALRLRDRDALDAFVARNATLQTHGQKATPMTSAEFLDRHAPTADQAQAIVRYLASMGLRNISIASNRMLVSADGTALTIGNAFRTTLAQVRTADGRIAYANTTDAYVPAMLADKVLAVIGLQTAYQAQRPSVPHIDPAHTEAVVTHDLKEFPVIYGASSLPPAPDIVVGIISDTTIGARSGMATVISDIHLFTSSHGYPDVATQVVQTNTAALENVPDEGADFVAQAVVAMAGGQVRKIIFYNTGAQSEADMASTFNAIVAANQTHIINIGNNFIACENTSHSDGSAATGDAILEAGVAQGQTFVAASGDDDTNICGTSVVAQAWPASSPYVITVSDTTLSASSTTWISETAYHGTSGGPSTFEPMPSWQSAAGVPGTFRGVPDVAFDGDKASGGIFYFEGSTTAAFTADFSAALFAGEWTRLLEAKGNGFGFAAPILYALPTRDFHDIVIGNNISPHTGHGFSAGPGYDFVSGRGSVILANALADSASLGNKPPVANFSFAKSGLKVTFTDTSTDSDGTIVSHTWQFGDGASSTATNPVHTYATAGTYKVTDRVIDNDGTSVIKAENVTVP